MERLALQRRYEMLFLLGWTLLNLWQSVATELAHDEAYYWVYSRDWALGYFDHAPMIAWMIRLGTELFSQTELGVRFLVVLANTLTLWLLARLCAPPHRLLFYAVSASIVLVHVGGFFAAPDIPLLLTGSWWFVRFRAWIQRPNIPQTLLLGLAAALVMWSKYHGAMLLFFTVLANLRLLGNPRFWLATGVGLLLYLPHLYWLWQHDFPTFVYHLSDRIKTGYTFQYTSDYLAGVVAASGPLVAVVLWPATFHLQTDPTRRALQFSSLGIVGALLLLTLSGRVEANWAAGALLGLMVLGTAFLANRQKWKRVFWFLAIPSYALFLVFRLTLVYDFVPLVKQLRPGFFGWVEWAERLEKAADGDPVVIADSYQLASKYMFYSGNTAWSYNSVYQRPNHFDLLATEEQLQGRSVLYYATGEWLANDPAFTALAGTEHGGFYRRIDTLRTFQKVRVLLPEPLLLPADDSVELPLTLVNRYDYPLDFGLARQMRVGFHYRFYQNGVPVLERDVFLPEAASLQFEDTARVLLPVHTPKRPGAYEIYVSLRYGWLAPGRHSGFVAVRLKN